MRMLSMAAAGLAFVVFLIVAGPAVADYGPHGGYSMITDACAGCHRAHTANAENLLTSSVPNLCVSCHGSSSAGAMTNVVDGTYDSVPPASLKGGGFSYALMDTNADMVAISTTVTSRHAYDGNTGTVWGNGAIGSGPGATIALTCINCHDPHGRAGTGGTATYRILRAVPSDSGASSGVNVADTTSKVYGIVIADPDYPNLYYGQDYLTRAAPLSNWCSQCHTRYKATSGSGHTDSGDAVFTYRHVSNGSGGPGCMTCHVAHGTTAGMGTYSGSVAWPDGTTSPNGNARSSLLRLDNRGVCQQCHNK